MDLLKEVRLMKTVFELRTCSTKWVKEFIVNLSVDMENEEIQEYMRVFVRGRCVKLSQKVINGYLGRSKSPPSDDIPYLDQIFMEITCVHASKWPKKNGIPIGRFIVKYVMIYRIGSSNSTPTNQKSNITSGLAKLIFQIITKAKIKFGDFVFEQTIKHVGLFIVKIPIAFICLISGIILKQHPDIVNRGDIKSKRNVPLSFYKKLFIGTHVLDMVMPKHKGQIIGGNSSPIAKHTMTNVLLVLKETSTDLQDTITSCSLRKQEVDELINLIKTRIMLQLKKLLKMKKKMLKKMELTLMRLNSLLIRIRIQ